MEKLNLLKVLVESSCEFAVNVPALGSNRTVVVTPEQALPLLQDKYEVYGALVGLRRTDYIESVISQGSVYFSASTQKGNHRYEDPRDTRISLGGGWIHNRPHNSSRRPIGLIKQKTYDRDKNNKLIVIK